MLSLTAYRAINTYGGVELWENLTKIKARVSAHGLLFNYKKIEPLVDAEIEVFVQEFNSVIYPISNSIDLYGFLFEKTPVLTNSTYVIKEAGHRSKLLIYNKSKSTGWNLLQKTYFVNYAFLNYIAFPKLLLHPKIKWVEPFNGMLIAEFPVEIPTHCTKQTFSFSQATGKLTKHYYTAEIIHPKASACNEVVAHSIFNGLEYPSKRIVYPDNPISSALKWPKLVELSITIMNID